MFQKDVFRCKGVGKWFMLYLTSSPPPQLASAPLNKSIHFFSRKLSINTFLYGPLSRFVNIVSKLIESYEMYRVKIFTWNLYHFFIHLSTQHRIFSHNNWVFVVYQYINDTQPVSGGYHWYSGDNEYPIVMWVTSFLTQSNTRLADNHNRYRCKVIKYIIMKLQYWKLHYSDWFDTK